MDVSYLQFLLYILGAVLLGALIVLIIRVIYTITKVNMILDTVEKRVRSVDHAIDSFSSATDKIVEGISSAISKAFSHKTKKSGIKEEVKEEK